MAVSASSIPESRIRKQAAVFYTVPFLWLLWLFLLPALFGHNRLLGIVLMIFPGCYLFTWLGYLMHECWHKYVPNVNNRFLYNLFSLLILTDPQLYSIIHGSHHAQVHTWDDSEFHPLGEIKSRMVRIVYNCLEIIFGVAFLVMIANITVPRDPRFSGRYRRRKLIMSIPLWGGILCGTGYLSCHVLGTNVGDVVVAYVIMYWLGSFLLHQSQLVEHGNRIVDGDFHRRNMQTRNLAPSGIFGRLFLFLTHNDSREHVLHHTLTKIYSRPFPGTIPLPEQSVTITVGGFLNVLKNMVAGKVDQTIAGT